MTVAKLCKRGTCDVRLSFRDISGAMPLDNGVVSYFRGSRGWLFPVVTSRRARPPQMLRCPHVFNAFSGKTAVVYERMKLLQRACQQCTDFEHLWICLNCMQNYCQEHLALHFPACGEHICYKPRQNIYYCFGCERQVMSFYLRSDLQRNAMRILTQRFARYRNYDCLSRFAEQKTTADAAVQVDALEVEFVPEYEVQAPAKIDRPLTARDIERLSKQNKELLAQRALFRRTVSSSAETSSASMPPDTRINSLCGRGV